MIGSNLIVDPFSESRAEFSLKVHILASVFQEMNVYLQSSAYCYYCEICDELLVLSKNPAHLAEENGVYLVHGIVDSLWLRKLGAAEVDFQKLCNLIHERLDLPIDFEGIYRWIVFLPSTIRPDIPVLNR